MLDEVQGTQFETWTIKLKFFESFPPHQDQNKKNFNQQNVIYVHSTINKTNNDNNFW